MRHTRELQRETKMEKAEGKERIAGGEEIYMERREGRKVKGMEVYWWGRR